MSSLKFDQLAHLRPTTVPEMLDRIFLIIKKNWVLFFCLSGLSIIANIFVLTVPLKSFDDNNKYIYYLLYFPLEILKSWCVGMGLLYALQYYLFPFRPTAFKSAAKTVFLCLPAVFFTTLIVAFASIMFIGVLVPIEETMKKPVGAFMISLGFFIMGMIMAMRWSLAPLLVIMERLTIFQSLRRSRELMNAYFSGGWQQGLTFRWICIVVLMLIVAILVSLPCLAAMVWMGRMPLSYDLRNEEVVNALLHAQLVGIFFAQPIFWAGMALLYAEIRVRKDGLDFQLRLANK